MNAPGKHTAITTDTRPGAPAPAAPPMSAPAANTAPLATTLANGGLMLAVLVIGGMTPVFAKDALDVLPAFSTGFFRFGTAAILLVITRTIWTTIRRINLDPIAREDWPRFALAGLICVPINQICFLQGVQWASAAHTGLLYGLTPVLMFGFTWLQGANTATRRMGVATILAFVGVATLGWDGLYLGNSWKFFAGLALVFGAVLTWCLFSLVLLPLSKKYGPHRAITYVFVLGALLYSWSPLVDGSGWDLAAIGPRAWFGFAFITLVTSFLNYSLWSLALTRVDINRLSIVTNAAPLVAVCGAWLWRDEPITRWLLVAAALVLSAMTLANWDKLRTVLKRPRTPRPRKQR